MAASPTDLPPVLPLALVLRGRRCLVVGAGRRAARRVRELAGAGADVTVVAPACADEVAELVAHLANVAWHERRFDSEDLDGVHLVVAATDDPDVDQRVVDLAEARGTFVHCPDDVARCSAYAMGLVRRGPVTVAVSTSGASPALAAYLRSWLEARLDDALGGVATLLCDVRRELHDDGRRTEGLAWERVVDDDLVAMVAAGETSAARDRVRATLLAETVPA
jgi:siroheme synthase-like protein